MRWRNAAGQPVLVEQEERWLLNVQRLGTDGLSVGIGGDLVDARFRLPQQFLTAPLQGLAAFVDGDDSSSGTLPSSSRLTIDSSSSIARSKLSFLTSTWVFSAIGFPDTLFVGPLQSHLCESIVAGIHAPSNAVTWAATDLRPCRSYPPSSTETIRPPALESATSISWRVTQPESSARRLSDASGSRKWASKPAEMMINSGLNFFNCGRIRFSNAARNLGPPSPAPAAH